MTWVIVLAGGSGARLADEAKRRYGYARPKQYCDFDGRGTLLDQTLRRARRIAPTTRTVVITTRAHRSEATEVLERYPGIRWIEQPCGLDTTPGLLLPLLHVLGLDPDATIVMLPSDHHVVDDGSFTRAVHDALDVVACDPGRIAVLGAEPGGHDEGYGWLVPAKDADDLWPAVDRFREKPPADERAELVDQGALVNTFVLAAHGWTLAGAFERWTPGWFRTLRAAAGRPDRVDAAFDVIEPSNFSREVLERIPHMLRIVALPARAGWSDVGTPERLAASARLARMGGHGEVPAAPG